MQGQAAARFSALIAVALTAALAVGCVQVANTAPTSPPGSPPATPPGPAASLGPTTSGVQTGSSSSAPSVATPAVSTDGSIVYILDSNVWLAAPDGSAARQLTTNGAEGAYHDPSQATDGTIFVLRGSNMLYHLDRVGGQVAQPVSLATLENGAEGLSASPEGTRVAFVTTGFGTEIDPRFGTPSGTFIYGGTDVATPDGTSVAGAAAASLLYPSWFDALTLVGSDGNVLYRWQIGQPLTAWLDLSNGCLTDFDCPAGDEPAASISEPALSVPGGLIAYGYKPYFGDAGRRLATFSAGSPASGEPATQCTMPGLENYSDPGSFSPSGDAYAFDDTAFDPDTFDTTAGDGIHVLSVALAAEDCGLSTATLVLRGASQPDWGPSVP